MTEDQYNEILNKPAFQNIEPERREAFRILLQRLEGKSMMESLAIIADFSRRLPPGRDLTKQEQEAMIAAMMESMDSGDKQRFNNILKMMNLLKR